jgi:protein-L-isoaspartate O-methyltransferase
MGNPVSSSTSPWLMAMMLEAAQVRSGQMVLEIGTGTGYNAALLAALVGDPALVTSIELDRAVASIAQRVLDRVAGPGVRVVVGDGLVDIASEDGFDRIIATVGCAYVPELWWRIMRPEGRVILCLQGSLGGGIAAIERTGPTQARGTFLDTPPVSFIRPPTADEPGPRPTMPPRATPLGHVRAGEFDPEALADRTSTFRMMLQLDCPSLTLRWKRPSGGDMVLAVLCRRTGQSVEFTPAGAGTWRVAAYGAGELWQRLLASYRSWVDLGRPGLASYQLAVKLPSNAHEVSLRAGDQVLRTWPWTPAVPAAVRPGAGAQTEYAHLRETRGREWTSFAHIADHIEEFALRHPDHDGAMRAFSRHLADLHGLPHEHRTGASAREEPSPQ